MDSIGTERPAMSEAVRHMMAMTDETVSAKYIAPILRMSESVIVKYAKDGTWDADRLGNFVISGDRVKFFRRDFLQKCGLMDPDAEEPTDHQLMVALVDALTAILEGQRMLLQLIDEQNDLLHAVQDPFYRIKKTAGAGTPTD